MQINDYSEYDEEKHLPWSKSTLELEGTEIGIQPYKALCSAVLTAAVTDLINTSMTSEAQRWRRTAAHFVDPENPIFRFYSLALDFDPEWLHRKIWQFVKKNGLLK